MVGQEESRELLAYGKWHFFVYLKKWVQNY